VTLLEIHGTRIRLWGIDAPESSQLCRDGESAQYQCGAKAANALDAFIARRPVDCSPVSLDRYGRTVAVCSIDRVEIAEWLVRKGSRSNRDKRKGDGADGRDLNRLCLVVREMREAVVIGGLSDRAIYSAK